MFITTTQLVRDFWSRNMFSIPRGAGSGFVWDNDGHVVTNFHVVSRDAEAKVRLTTAATIARAWSARARRTTSPCCASACPTGSRRRCRSARRADLKVGQKVFAIGNPFGLDWSLTTGMVSALDRSMPAEDGRTSSSTSSRPTPRSIPGNSGGPLLDSSGRLIGINTAIFSPSGAMPASASPSRSTR